MFIESGLYAFCLCEKNGKENSYIRHDQFYIYSIQYIVNHIVTISTCHLEVSPKECLQCWLFECSSSLLRNSGMQLTHTLCLKQDSCLVTQLVNSGKRIKQATNRNNITCVCEEKQISYVKEQLSIMSLLWNDFGPSLDSYYPFHFTILLHR